MPELVHLDVDDGVGIVRLDRPPANAISLHLSIELLRALQEAGSRDDVGALVLWGGPKLFAAGADIKEMVDLDHDEIREQVTELGDACDLLEAMPKISIAAITGFALGGGFELSLACDLRYAADDARVGQPEIKLGVIPGAGGTQRMTWLAGAGVARDLTYTGRQVEADEAKALRLVERVLPADQVLEAAVQDARRVRPRPADEPRGCEGSDPGRGRDARPDEASVARRSSSSSCSGPLTSAKACGRSSRSDPPPSAATDGILPHLCPWPVAIPWRRAGSRHRGMNRSPASFESHDEDGDPIRPPVRATKGRERDGGGEFPRPVGPDAPEGQQALPGGPHVRGAGMPDQALDLQQVGLLLAARTGAHLRRSRQAPQPQGDGSRVRRPPSRIDRRPFPAGEGRRASGPDPVSTSA